MRDLCLVLGEEASTVVETTNESLLAELWGDMPYAHLGPPLADARSLNPGASRRPRMYCNRADTCWYAVDTRLAPARRKPHR